MSRATYARVSARLGGDDPSGWVQADIEGLCTQADYIIDAETYPETLSTTSDLVIELAVDVVLRMMRLSDFMHEASGSAGHDGRMYPDIPVLNKELKDRIARLSTSQSTGSFTTIDMIG